MARKSRARGGHEERATRTWRPSGPRQETKGTLLAIKTSKSTFFPSVHLATSARGVVFGYISPSFNTLIGGLSSKLHVDSHFKHA